ncbi:MAG: rhodanese-like domain-containing protein [Crocinitomicaceae bacterium]|nr:rhodanese-like domain-containing protein [Crocinitomicaceae bacterium]
MRLFILYILVSFNGFGQTAEYMKMIETYYNDFPTISCTTAAQLIGDSSIYFLDAREEIEFNVSHIKGAKNIGYNDFKLENIKSIPKNATIIVYCSIGARSQNLGEKIVAAGYKNVRNLYGGFFQWNNSGLPKYSNNRRTNKIHGYSNDWGKWITKGSIVY